MTIAQAVKKSTGMTFTKYCEQVLKTNYKAFQYRYKRGLMKVSEVNQIILDTGLSYEELFIAGSIQKPVKQEPGIDRSQATEKAMAGQETQQDQLPQQEQDEETKEVNFSELYRDWQ